MAEGSVVCPFCGFKRNGEYHIQLHIEEQHTEDSPFAVDETASEQNLRPPLPPRPISGSGSNSSSRPQSDDNPWVKCTRPNCGEYVAIQDIQEHLDLHEAAAISEDDGRNSNGRATPSQSNGSLVPPAEERQTYLQPNGQSYRSERRSPMASREDLAQSNGKAPSSDAESVKASAPRSPQKRPRSSNPASLNNSPKKMHRPRQPSSNNSSHSSQFGSSILNYFSGTSQKGPPDRRDGHSSSTLQHYQRRRIRPPLEPGRLGKRELGPHAFEDAMPESVKKHLLNDAAPRERNRIGRDGRIYREIYVENETANLVPILSDLCANDPDTVKTYLCHPSVRHIEKLQCDGNFCGYWNIQMLLTYIHDQDARRANRPPKDTPNVLKIQNVIEQAWQNGICSYGRIETGGLKNTRKWIGTHEALAFFTQIGVEVEALSFKTEATTTPPASDTRSSSSSSNSNGSQLAVTQLLDHIEAYFIFGLDSSATTHYRTSTTTALPPIYFQRFGHSMTIVGLERKKDGRRNLLLFDPSFGTAGPMQRLLAGKRVSAGLEAVLRPYRRSELGLSRWDEFEVVVPKMTKVQVAQARPGSSG